MAEELVPPQQTVKFVVSGAQGNANWANVFWIYVGGINQQQADLDGLTSAFGEMYFAQLGTMLFPDTSVKLCQATFFNGPQSALHSNHAMTHVGTSAGTPINEKSACRVLSWNSNVYWRGGKPRTYVPGVATADTTDGMTLVPASKNQYAINAQNLHVAINALNFGNFTQSQHGFVSFHTGGTLRTPGVFFPITGGTAHGRIGSQRRRLGSWIP